MTKFCDNCPMKFQATGDINSTVSCQINYETRAVMGRGALLDRFNGLAGVLIDENSKPSWPMKFPGQDPAAARERYTQLVEVCEGPETETRGVFRKREYVTACGALGTVALGEPIASQILLAARVELI